MRIIYNMLQWFNDGKKEYYQEICPEGCVKGRLKKETVLDKNVKIISYESLYSFYIDQNNSLKTCSDHFNVPKNQVLELLKYYNISKTDLHIQASFINPRTHEDFIEAGKKSRITQKEKWKNKTEEEKLAWSNKMSKSHKTAHFKEISGANNTSYRNSLSPEEDAEQNRKRSQTLKEFWAGLSEEEKWRRLNNQFTNGAGYKTSNSKPNIAFINLLEENHILYQREFRINNFSYDFLVNGNILIEINPAPTHNVTWSPFPNSQSYTDKKYHQNKTQNALDNGYRCIHIWDWDDIDKIIELLKPRRKIYARKCLIKEIDGLTSKDFINRYHLQGYAKSKIDIGLYYNNDLVAVMTFDKPRYNKKYEYELVRFCSKYNIIGGSQKLFNYFMKHYGPKSIISYCDKSKFDGHTYLNLGFVYKGQSLGKHWYNLKTKQHITDNLLRQRGFDQLLGKEYGCFGKGTDNEVLMKNAGFVEIYDAGQAKYEYVRGEVS